MSYDLTGEKISFTYGRVVQVVSGSYYDGFGNPLPIGTSSVVITGSLSGYATTGSNTFIGNQIISGSLIVTNGITGSLYGTSSYSNNSTSASYAPTNTNITASWSINSVTASYVVTAQTASYYGGSVVSSSYALTASYALNGGSGGTTLITGSTYPITSSWANNVVSASYALTASYCLNSSNAVGADAVSGSFSSSSIWEFTHSLNANPILVQAYDTNFNQIIPQNIFLLNSNVVRLSFPVSASGYAIAARSGIQIISSSVGTGLITGSTYPITSSWANNVISSSYSLTSSYSSNSTTASYSLTASYWSGSVISASYALTASYALNAGTATNVSGGTVNVTNITASNISASRITGSLYGTSSWANNVISSSYALTASFALNGGGGGTTLVTGSTYPITSSWSNNTISASYALTSSYAVTASYALNSATASYCINPFPISGSLGYWGSFWDTTTQTNVSSSNVMRLNNTDSDSNGVRITSGSKITFDHDGVYNLQFSAVFTSNNASSNDVNVWFDKNGSTLADSNTILTIAGQSNAVAAWNYVLKLYTGDFIQLYWNSSESTMQIEYFPSQSVVIPATPSLIVTATQVTNTQITPSASYAVTASYVILAQSASYYAGSVTSASYALSASFSPVNTNITTSWSNNSLTASSINFTASNATLSQTASYIINAQSASYYGGSVTSASYSLSASFAPTNTNITSSWSINSLTSSYVVNAQSASYYGGNVTSSSYSTTSSYSNSSISSSYSLSASYAPVNTNITASWSTNSLTASSINFTASNAILAQTASYYGGSVTSASYSLSASYAPTNNNLTASYAILTSVSMSLNFVDDTAAAAGGVPLGGLYRNGNFILIRLT
jgi:hypothetical protein